MVYQFRATIPESKIFYRVYEIKGEMTLFKFNSFIIDDLGFSPDQMVLFEGYDEKGALDGEYGLFDLGDGAMDTVTFDDVVGKGETSCTIYSTCATVDISNWFSRAKSPSRRSGSTRR